ncbi:hypothetical protein B0H14DRAFT_3520781 [Mycena olivaceomarginata]|nr:hypothetical protein B0H14DRAFT_3520781 [Mycena olivaceomarginata]
MQNSTDDEAGDTQSTKRIVPCYHFDYPSLTADDVPVFSTKAFWDCFHSSEARTFAKLICRICHPRYKSGSDQEHQSLLEQALPEFRLALSRVDATQELPKDVTLALAGLNCILIAVTDSPSEYSHLTLPDLDAGPYFSPAACPPTSQKQATDAEIRNAPHFYRQLPTPVKKGKAPVKPSNKRAHNSTDEEEKSSGKAAPPAQKKAKLDPVASTSKATPAKGPAPILCPLPPVNYSKDMEPSDDQTASGNKRRTGRASKKQERLKQKEREHKATEAMVDALTTQLRDSAITLIKGRDNFTLIPFNNQSLVLTLSYLQEHRSYTPRTVLGPGSNYSKSKEDAKFTPIRSVPILAADQMELENAIRPKWPCALCSLYRVICKPMGVGMACTNCNVKKLNSLCDHQMSGARINRLYHDLAESAKVFSPAVDLDVQRLIKAGSAAADTSSLAYHLHETFIEDFHRYIEALSEHHSRVRTEAFNESFAPSVSMDARELLQDLIAEFNYLGDPAPHVEGSMSPHESCKGSTAAPSPPSDENDNKGKGEAIPTTRFPAPPGLEAAWLKLVRHSKQFQESKNEGQGSCEDHLDAIAAAWAPFLKSELIDLGVLSKQYTLLMTGDHNKAHQWSSQLGSETATKDVPLPQEVENFLSLVRPSSTNVKECEVKREQALATKQAAATPKETTSSGKRARSESVSPSDVDSEDQIDTDVDMDPDEDFLGTPRLSCPDMFSENGQGRGKSHRAQSHTDAESVADAPVKKKAIRVRFPKKTGPAGPAVTVDSGSPVIALSVTAGPAVVEQNEATVSSNTVSATSFSFDDIGKMINSGKPRYQVDWNACPDQRRPPAYRVFPQDPPVSDRSAGFHGIPATWSTREFPSVPATGTSATTPHPDPWPFQLVPARSIADVVVVADSSLVAVGITRNTEGNPEEV